MLRRLSGRSLADRYLERGLYHLDKKSYQDAIADLVEAIAQDPFNAELYTTRGFIYLDSNRPDYLPYATADFEYALYLDPAQWVAEYCLGMIAYAEEQYDKALRHFTTARDFAHLHPEVYYYRALCYYRLGDPERALKEMSTAYDQFVEQKDSRKSFARQWKAEFKRAIRQKKALERPPASRRPSVAGPPGAYEPPRLTGPDQGESGDRPDAARSTGDPR